MVHLWGSREKEEKDLSRAALGEEGNGDILETVQT